MGKGVSALLHRGSSRLLRERQSIESVVGPPPDEPPLPLPLFVKHAVVPTRAAIATTPRTVAIPFLVLTELNLLDSRELLGGPPRPHVGRIDNTAGKVRNISIPLEVYM
jgi:hypothetical protein